MKKNMKNYLALILLTGFTALVSSCNDGSEAVNEPSQDEMEVSENSSTLSALAEEDIEIGYLAAESVSSGNGKTAGYLPCAVITNDTDLRIVTIDFGAGCVGPYGRERSGKILIHYSTQFNDQLANRIITFENYMVNNRKIEGEIDLRNINRNLEGFLSATRELKDYTITFPNGNHTVLNGVHVREWIEGEGDQDPTTNVYRLTGYFTGISTRGRSYTQTIIEPVIASFACRSQGGFLRTAGVIEWQYNGEAVNRVRVLNYGSGDCDNTFTVTINGRVFTISG